MPGNRYAVLVGQRFFGKRVFAPVRLKPGETKDLGEARVKRGP